MVRFKSDFNLFFKIILLLYLVNRKYFLNIDSILRHERHLINFFVSNFNKVSSLTPISDILKHIISRGGTCCEISQHFPLYFLIVSCFLAYRKDNFCIFWSIVIETPIHSHGASSLLYKNSYLLFLQMNLNHIKNLTDVRKKT